MGSFDTILTSGLSSFTTDGGLTKSLLDSASLSPALGDDSALLGLSQVLKTPVGKDPILSGFDLLSTSNTTGNTSSQSNSQSSPTNNIFNNSLSSQPPLSNSTSGLDPLTGSTTNAPLVGTSSNDPLTNATTTASSPVTGNQVTNQTASPAFAISPSSSSSSSSVSEGDFGSFGGQKDVQLTIKDPDGNKETFSLTGDGYGEVFKDSNSEQVVFTGIDKTTSVQISADNNIKFGDYTGASLKVQTTGSITAGKIALKNTASSSNPGLRLQSGLSNGQSSVSNGIYKITDLGVLPGDSYSSASAINSSGQIAGGSGSSYTSFHAFLYSNGKMTNLGTLPGYSFSSSAFGINNSGQVVGYSVDAWFHAFLYSNGQMTDLGTLPGGITSQALGINNSGQVVGSSGTSDSPEHAFLYSNGKMTDLGTLPGYSNSYASAINNSGTVVGSSNGGGIDGTPDGPFLYRNGQMSDLNSLIAKGSGWTLNAAAAINDSGQIVGSGTIGGQHHAFLLSPASTATPQDGITVGNISTQGDSIQLQGQKINLTGSEMTSKGGNITLDGPTLLNSSTGAIAFHSTAGSKDGDISFKNTVDGNSANAQSLSLTAGQDNISFNNAVGSSASLKDLTVKSAQTVTAKGDITTDGDTTISATQDITTSKLTSNSGAVKLTSEQGAVTTQDIISGGKTTIAANSNIATHQITSAGAVSLISSQGAVTTQGDITATSGGVAALATQNIATGNIHSQKGTVALSSYQGAVTVSGDLTTSGGGVDLAAGSNVATHNIVANGGAVSLTSSLGTVTTQGDLTTSGDVNVKASGDVATHNILSQGGAVNLSSAQGSLTAAGDITASSYVDIAASGGVAAHNILSSSGAISLDSSQGAVTISGDLTTSGGYVDIAASSDVATNNIRTAGGGINLTSFKGAVTTGFLGSDGNSTDGDVDLQAAGPIRVTGSVAINGTNYSIYTGATGDGSITIGDGGNSLNPATPFAVGDATTNGTAAAISTGTDTISPLTSITDSYTQGNLDIFPRSSAPSPEPSPSPSPGDNPKTTFTTDPSGDIIEISPDGTVIISIGSKPNSWPSKVPSDKQQELAGFVDQLLSASQPLGEFFLGAMYQWLYDTSAPIKDLLAPLQLTPKEESLLEANLPQSTAFKLGRTLGGGAVIVQGILEFLQGTAGEAEGGGLCITGVGCFAGAPAIAVGAILQYHGAAAVIHGATDESNLLRELLSPTHLESTTGGSEELAKGLGVSSEQIDKALSVLSPEKVQQLSGELGQEQFQQLLKKDQNVIHDVSRALDLIGDDTAALDSIKKVLELNGPSKGTISNQQLGDTFSELVKFTERYGGDVSGDFAYRFARAEGDAKKFDPAQAQGEIKAAEDFMGGKTTLGHSRVDGLPESEIDGVETPEFRVTGADGITRLAEVKTTEGPLSKTNIKNNLKKAISQIKVQAKETGETGAYIRLDASTSPSTTLTSSKIRQFVKGQLLDPKQEGINYVEFVEVLYNDTKAQPQKLLLRAENGDVVIVP